MENLFVKSLDKPKVLIADDEHVIADTLAIILNQSGFSATAVYSGEAVLHTAETLQPALIISDVVMKGMSGVETAMKIQGMLPLCKILLFSGQTARADLIKQAKVLGASFEVLAKPVLPHYLIARLRGGD